MPRLTDPRIGSIVEDVILQADGERYALFAWCIMPDHVHVVIRQGPGARLDRIVQAWKSATAHRINTALGRRGRVWAREYFDRFMRDDDQFKATIAYVESNPVRAGLVERAEAWRFSSAWDERR